jgi:hypothetical protein
MANDQNDHYGDDEQAWESGEGEDSGQLSMDHGDDQLPWLESDDDYAEEGVDTARIVAFGLIGLVIVGLLVGGAWWWFNRDGDPSLAPDGSTIAAPEGPFRERPEESGGRVFDGTGDVAPAVSEGQTREGVLESSESPRPSVETATVENTTTRATGVGVQIGAFQTRQSAERGWQVLVGQHSVLAGLEPRIIEGEAEFGTVFRLQAIAADRAAADRLCATLRSNGGSCQVKP